MRIVRIGGWLTARIGHELVMMSAEAGMYLGLTEVGARVWELLDTESELDRICDALRREFDVPPDVCRAEVEVFVEEMAGRGVLAIETA